MASGLGRCALALLVIASSFAGSCMASRDWRFGFNYTDWRLKHGYGWWHHYPNKTQEAAPNKIVVGGSEHWHFGFNYTNWALNHGPFYHNDVLVKFCFFFFFFKRIIEMCPQGFDDFSYLPSFHMRKCRRSVIPGPTSFQHLNIAN